MSATPEADIPVERLILCVILQKKQLNLMGLVHAMRSNGPLPQVTNNAGVEYFFIRALISFLLHSLYPELPLRSFATNFSQFNVLIACSSFWLEGFAIGSFSHLDIRSGIVGPIPFSSDTILCWYFMSVRKLAVLLTSHF